MFKSEYPKCLVLEVGADHPGDIESVSKWLKSDIVVITKIGEVPVHVEAFPTVADLVKEKSFLIKTLKSDGVLVLSADDKMVSDMSKGVTQKIVSFGMKQIATVNASDSVITYDDNSIPSGMSFKINTQGNSVPVKIKGILGVQQIYPVIAGIAVGIVKNIPLIKIIDSLDNHVSPKGRMNILKGINDSIIIDDSYNSSPDALAEGLNTLASLQVSGKRIAVIGDMMELGSFSIEEHKKAGIKAMQSCDILITVGQRSKVMSDNAIKFNNSIEASEYLKGIVARGDVVFIKGSQSMRMERICKTLLREGENATELLVRQEPEWLAKK
jgi:UDP-N-acetylmuramoyl-tripeptide--D-alanyl-D-alanine ligase